MSLIPTVGQINTDFVKIPDFDKFDVRHGDYEYIGKQLYNICVIGMFVRRSMSSKLYVVYDSKLMSGGCIYFLFYNGDKNLEIKPYNGNRKNSKIYYNRQTILFKLDDGLKLLEIFLRNFDRYDWCTFESMMDVVFRTEW